MSYLDRLKAVNTGKTNSVGTDKTDISPFVSFVSSSGGHFPENDGEPDTQIVTVEIPGKACCDMAVPADRVQAFVEEATWRGLIVRYRLQGSDTQSLMMPGPGDSVERLKDRLRAEFGERLVLEAEERDQ